jgi:hypothetical protein
MYSGCAYSHTAIAAATWKGPLTSVDEQDELLLFQGKSRSLILDDKDKFNTGNVISVLYWSKRTPDTGDVGYIPGRVADLDFEDGAKGFLIELYRIKKSEVTSALAKSDSLHLEPVKAKQVLNAVLERLQKPKIP